MTRNQPDRQDGDRRLLAELGAAFARAEQPPTHVVIAAKAAFSMRALDAELAILSWDSEIDTAPAAVRGPVASSEYRSLAFDLVGSDAGSPDAALSIEVEVGPAALGRPLAGQLVPPQVADVLVVPEGGGPIRMPADQVGRFGADALPAGLFRLRVERPGRPPVVTSWVRLD